MIKAKVEFNLEKVRMAMFWLQVFGDMGMTKDDKGSIVWKNHWNATARF